MQITSDRPIGVVRNRTPDQPAHRAARAEDNWLLVLWGLLSLACCAAAMVVVDVL